MAPAVAPAVAPANARMKSPPPLVDGIDVLMRNHSKVGTGALNILQIMVGTAATGITEPSQAKERPPPPRPVFLKDLVLEVATRPYYEMDTLDRWFHAAKLGDLAVLKEIHAKDASLLNVTKQGIGNTALHWCASKGNLDCVEWLLDEEASINSRNAGESTPLHSAAGCGQRMVLVELLKRNANPDLKDSAGVTADQLALSKGYEEAAVLIQKVQNKRSSTLKRQAILASGASLAEADAAEPEHDRRSDEVFYDDLKSEASKRKGRRGSKSTRNLDLGSRPPAQDSPFKARPARATQSSATPGTPRRALVLGTPKATPRKGSAGTPQGGGLTTPRKGKR